MTDTTTMTMTKTVTTTGSCDLQEKAYDMVLNTGCSFFLTGRAGTGKTTFLKRIQEEVKKNFIVVAPTGVAALLAGGETIHSFFGLPLEVFTPQSKIRISETKRLAMLKADCIIIDEVSMARCDMIDGIDYVLRHIMHSGLPFGGKQVIFSGDIYQLSPVVDKKDKVMMDMLHDLYHTDKPYFYKANVFRKMRMPAIEFQKVYRQTDREFLDILSDVRMGHVTQHDLQVLNACVGREWHDDALAITLTAHNKTADSINTLRLDEIGGEEYVYEGEVKDVVRLKDFPAPMQLRLKVGAQVMFCRNDVCHRWVNGTLATVVELGQDQVRVRMADGTECGVGKTVWEFYDQKYNKDEKKLEKKVVGSYTQYPLKLAWAITIHKSQGMTFERLVLDLSRGIFMPGQLYVALSRLTSLDGLSLSSPIKEKYAMPNTEVKVFAETFNNAALIEDELLAGKTIYPHLSKGDYDASCKACLDLVLLKIAENKLRDSALMAKRMFDIMVSDDCLIESLDNPPMIAEPTCTNRFLNAVLSLYSGQYDMAVGFADLVLSTSPNCKEAMYVKSRALGLMGRWEEADRTNVELMKLQRNQNEDVDGKSLRQVAVVNMSIGDPALGVLQKLIQYRRNYVSSVLLLRSYMHEQGQKLEQGEASNVIISKFDDCDCSDDSFVATYREKAGSQEQKEFLKVVGALAFE